MTQETTLALDLKRMSRMQLIEAIRPIAHPQTFHQMLAWPTEALRLYILQAKSGETD